MLSEEHNSQTSARNTPSLANILRSSERIQNMMMIDKAKFVVDDEDPHGLLRFHHMPSCLICKTSSRMWLGMSLKLEWPWLERHTHQWRMIAGGSHCCCTIYLHRTPSHTQFYLTRYCLQLFVHTEFSLVCAPQRFYIGLAGGTVKAMKLVNVKVKIFIYPGNKQMWAILQKCYLSLLLKTQLDTQCGMYWNRHSKKHINKEHCTLKQQN